jgi:hypothetical protein
MMQDFKEYFSKLFLPFKNLFEKEIFLSYKLIANKEFDPAIVEKKIVILKDGLAKIMRTASLLLFEKKQIIIQANEFYKYIDAHINLLKELPKSAQDGINEQCKKILYIIYTDVMLNETGTKFYKYIAAQVGLHPKTEKHTLHLSDKKIELMYDMAFVAVSDGTFGKIVQQTEERIRSLEDLKSVINNLRIFCKRESVNRNIIKPLKEVKDKYWTLLNAKQDFTEEDELLVNEALEEFSKVEAELEMILDQRKKALKQNTSNPLWENVTGEERLLRSLQQCASLKWYEHKEDLTGQLFNYDIAFALAVRERAKAMMIASEQTFSIFDETDFKLHKRVSHISNIPLYWKKDVLSDGKVISEDDTLVDPIANSQFLEKSQNATPQSLIDEQANAVFLETHYRNHRYEDGTLISPEDYEDYLRFKVGQRESGKYYYVFDW